LLPSKQTKVSSVRTSDGRERRFPNASALNDALAADIASALEDGLGAGRGASLVVPGGRTPIALFEQLSGIELDWQNVWITLTDERWVEPTSSASNEKLVRDHLLRGAAAQANFIGMKSAAAEPQAAAASSWSAIAELPRPFDFVLLGMGEDGHIASLFPDSPGLALGLDPAQPPGCLGMLGPTAPRQRLSLNLRALLDSRRIAVLIVGAAKWAVYERARVRGPAVDLPLRALLQQQNVPVSVYWSP
jgi:6-phosphogluconolactonase